MRQFINIVEGITDEYNMTMAINHLENAIDWSGGSGEGLIEDYMNDYDIDPDEVDMSQIQGSPEFTEWFKLWAEQAIRNAWHEINDHLEQGKNGTHRCYRMITAGRDWKPTDRDHLGQYWAWDKNSAAAHWGSFEPGQVQWLLTADIPDQSIDWERTLAANADPSTGGEAEITLRHKAPVHLIAAKVIER